MRADMGVLPGSLSFLLCEVQETAFNVDTTDTSSDHVRLVGQSQVFPLPYAHRDTHTAKTIWVFLFQSARNAERQKSQ